MSRDSIMTRMHSQSLKGLTGDIYFEIPDLSDRENES